MAKQDYNPEQSNVTKDMDLSDRIIHGNIFTEVGKALIYLPRKALSLANNHRLGTLALLTGVGAGAGYHAYSQDSTTKDKIFNEVTYTMVDSEYFERKENMGYSLDTLMNVDLEAEQALYDNKVEETNNKFDAMNDKAKTEAEPIWGIEAELSESGTDYQANIAARRERLGTK